MTLEERTRMYWWISSIRNCRVESEMQVVTALGELRKISEETSPDRTLSQSVKNLREELVYNGGKRAKAV